MPDTEKFYQVSAVAKEDLLSVRPCDAERIAALSDAQMERIAEKFGDALQDYYWDILTVILDLYLPKQADCEQEEDDE